MHRVNPWIAKQSARMADLWGEMPGSVRRIGTTWEKELHKYLLFAIIGFGLWVFRFTDVWKPSTWDDRGADFFLGVGLFVMCALLTFALFRITSDRKRWRARHTMNLRLINFLHTGNDAMDNFLSSADRLQAGEQYMVLLMDQLQAIFSHVHPRMCVMIPDDDCNGEYLKVWIPGHVRNPDRLRGRMYIGPAEFMLRDDKRGIAGAAFYRAIHDVDRVDRLRGEKAKITIEKQNGTLVATSKHPEWLDTSHEEGLLPDYSVVWCIPLCRGNNAPVAVLCVDSKMGDAFDDEDLVENTVQMIQFLGLICDLTLSGRDESPIEPVEALQSMQVGPKLPGPPRSNGTPTSEI